VQATEWIPGSEGSPRSGWLAIDDDTGETLRVAEINLAPAGLGTIDTDTFDLLHRPVLQERAMVI
jgi:hypothetical protein